MWFPIWSVNRSVERIKTTKIIRCISHKICYPWFRIPNLHESTTKAYVGIHLFIFDLSDRHYFISWVSNTSVSNRWHNRARIKSGLRITLPYGIHVYFRPPTRLWINGLTPKGELLNGRDRLLELSYISLGDICLTVLALRRTDVTLYPMWYNDGHNINVLWSCIMIFFHCTSHCIASS